MEEMSLTQMLALLTISPIYIFQVIGAVCVLIGVFIFRSETWKGFLWNVILVIGSSLYILVYGLAWYFRIKYDIPVSFDMFQFTEVNEETIWNSFITEPRLTGNAISHGLLLYFIRKLNGWYMWPVRLLLGISVILFFIVYIPVFFEWILHL